MASKLWTGEVSAAFATATNWFDDTVPGASGDDATADWNSQRGIDGSDQSATALTKLSIYHSMPYYVGSLATPLKIIAAICDIGLPGNGPVAASGPGRVNLDLHTTATVVTVANTSSSSTDGSLEPVRIKAVNAANILNVLAGRVGVATNALGDVATFATANISGGTVNLGIGLTLATLNMSAGVANLRNTLTTANVNGGVLNSLFGDFAITTLNVIKGTANIFTRKASGATVATVNLYDGAVLDLSSSAQAVTLTTVNVNGNARIVANAANPAHVIITTLNRNRGSLTLAAA